MAISVIINTLNEEKHIERCLQSLGWADEIVVYDGTSADRTVEIAKKYTDKIFTHSDNSGYVETVRNAAIEHASNDWVFVVDADEEIPPTLAEELIKASQNQEGIMWFAVPRKNFVFGKWLKASGWWPDYNIRFFKKGSVVWSNEIHVPPKTEGKGSQLDAVEQFAIIHHHYESISQYLQRLDRYTTIQAANQVKVGHHFVWHDFLRRPLSEFLTRFFVWQGYKDGLHGLALSLLQAFSFLVMYLKIWEMAKYPDTVGDRVLQEVAKEVPFLSHELSYWFAESRGKTGIQSKIRRMLKRP